jgi:DNA-binding transcriptional ArsR family regulator
MAKRPQLYEEAQGFGLLSEVIRLGIVKALTAGPKNVAALCKAVGANQPTVSHHLGLLRMGRLVIGTRKGRHDRKTDAEEIGRASLLPAPRDFCLRFRCRCTCGGP